MRPKTLSSVSVHAILAGVLSAIGSFPLLLFEGVPGYDASSHVAKTAFLMYSFAHGNFLGWSQFWYSGFQLFYTYSPLTYLLAGGLGWPFGSAILGMKILIALSFVMSGLGAYALARDFGIGPNWSLVAALLYSLTSPHLLILFYTGSLTYGLAFAMAPFLFLSARVAIRSQTLNSTVAFGVMIALLILSNETTAYVLFFPLAAYILLAVPTSRAVKSALVIVASSTTGLLLSAFWLLPYLQTAFSGQVILLTESETGAYPSANIIHWYSFFIPNLGNANAGDLGWVLVLPALASVFFLKKREELALYGAAVVSGLLTIGPTLTPLFYKIPLVLALQFSWRFVIDDVLFMAPLAVIFFARLFRRFSLDKVRVQHKGRTLAVVLILLLFAIPPTAISMSRPPSSYFLPPQTPSDPGQQEAFNFLAGQPGFFRVMVIDRYYESFPQFTLKGSIDGWYDQATTQAYRNFTYNVYYCGASNRTLNGLRLLGARYVMIDNGYGGDATSAIQAYNSSASVFGPPVWQDAQVKIYQVPDSQLVYVTGSLPNSEFGLAQDVDCNDPIPGAPSQQLSYSISNLNWGETKISFDLDVNQSSYVLISNSYSAGWIAKDNGSTIPILLSPPDLPVIHVSPGLSKIVLRYSAAPTEQEAAILSLGVFLGMSTGVAWRRSRAWTQSFQTAKRGSR